MVNFDLVNRAVLAHFAEPSVLTVDAATHAVDAAFSRDWQNQQILGIEVPVNGATAEVLEADYNAAGASAGSTVTLTAENGDVFTVVSAVPDGTGMMLLLLRPE